MKLLKKIGRWISSIFRRKQKDVISAETIEWIQKKILGLDMSDSEVRKDL